MRIKRFGLNWNVDWLAGQSLLPFSESTSANQCCSMCKWISIARRRRLVEAVRRGEGTGMEGEQALETNNEEPRPAPTVRIERAANKRAADAKERAAAAVAELEQLPADPVAAAGN